MKKHILRGSILFILILSSYFLKAQDSSILKVHFLYGSKPKKEFRDTEHKWFGGKLGGHVGIEGYENNVLNFVPAGKFHIIHKENNRHSAFVTHSVNSFYSLFGGQANKMKKTIILIPISASQKAKFDSISRSYITQTPYDYAFIGKRCGSAAYDILSQLDILPRYGHGKTFMKIFYPKKLRKRLLKKANSYNWKIIRKKGTSTRKWEMD